jgi:hypothetical protein
VKRVSTIAAALAVLALAVVLLVGCVPPAGAQDPRQNDPGIVPTQVHLPDGTTMQCVRYYSASLTCNWAHRWEE